MGWGFKSPGDTFNFGQVHLDLPIPHCICLRDETIGKIIKSVT